MSQQKILNEILSYNSYLYHVTEFSNLESILKNGLLCDQEIKTNRIQVNYMTSESSRTMDNKLGSDYYVRLAYTLAYDMFSAKIYHNTLIDPVILLIDPEVILCENTKFTTSNGVLGGAKLCTAKEVFSLLEFEKIYEKKTWDNRELYKNERQSEVLILNNIPLCFISKVIVEEYKEYDHLEQYGIPISESNVKETLKKIE